MKGRLLAAMLMALVSGLFSLTPMADRLENQYALGLLYLIRQPVQPPPGAVIIALDKQSLEWLRNSEEEKTEFLKCLPPSLMDSLNQIRSPGSVPRAVHACLLAKLKEAGVRVVVFDILFGATGDIEDDEQLANALRKYGSVAILVGFDRAVVSDGGSEILVEREVKPAKLFSETAAATGAFVVPRSGGPVYGYWQVVPGFANTRSLPEAALGLSTNLNTPQPRAITGVFKYLWLYGAPGTIQTIPARDVLKNNSLDGLRISSETVAFLGAADPTVTNYPDTFPSFFRSESDANLSGVELLATAYLNLRHNQILTRLSNLAWVIVVMAVAAAFGLAVQIYPSHPLLILVGMTAIYVGLSSFAFASAKLFLPVATPLFFSVPAAVFFAILTRYRFARTLIMHLAPKPVARRMLTSMMNERGAAVSGEATVVFFDLIGSTAIGEKIPAVAFSTLLNNYHDLVTQAVTRHRGFVTAFSGDGVTAVFTREDAGPDHAARACSSALAVIHDLRLLNQSNTQIGLPQLATRVGINSGLVAEGEMGARDRFNFSVVGDAVNLAARLEQLGKTLFPGENDIILVGRSTIQMAEDKDLFFLNCGICAIPGREKPEQVYRLRVQ